VGCPKRLHPKTARLIAITRSSCLPDPNAGDAQRIVAQLGADHLDKLTLAQHPSPDGALHAADRDRHRRRLGGVRQGAGLWRRRSARLPPVGAGGPRALRRMRHCWSRRTSDGTVVAGDFCRFVGDVSERRPKRELFDSITPIASDAWGQTPAKTNTYGRRASDVVTDEARCGEPTPSRQVRGTVAHAILRENAGARETIGSDSLSGIGGLVNARRD
jgi:hypothetical protein